MPPVAEHLKKYEVFGRFWTLFASKVLIVVKKIYIYIGIVAPLDLNLNTVLEVLNIH